MGKHIPLIIIVGPTAVGKTEISIKLAKRLHGEIISADSRLFYRGMDIGTAKPTFDEREGVPHHLIDVAEPDEIWNLAIFRREISTLIPEIKARGHLPFLVGGTGQFIRSIVEGWTIPESHPKPALRRALELWGEEIGKVALHEKLNIVDPIAAQKIDPRNMRRTIRAMEVVFNTGKRFSEQRSVVASPYDSLMIGLNRPREELYKRIDARIDMMFENGFVYEVKSLLSLGYSTDLPTMSAIGYREVIDYLDGKTTLEEAKRLIKRATRTFVRRQTNWFKPTDPKIHWFEMGSNVLDEIYVYIQNWLTG
jgi:tRNA dimethylallyltransferase